MSKLFISYRRKSWPFTHRLADELRKHLDAEIFVDLTGIDEDNFEHSILRNLRDSDAVLLVVSEHTFTDRIHRDDDWVRREIREALEHNIPIVLVCVEGLLPPAGLPEDISAISRKQGINFYPDFFSPAVKQLAEFVVKISRRSDAAALLPRPFDWIEIPGGRGTLKTDESSVTLSIPAERYWIAKYPVTNAQYAKFIEVGGYREHRWWTAAGWGARLKGWIWDSRKSEYVVTDTPWTEPRYWQDNKWNGDTQPVVGVSWYEAVAFCLWLSEVTGEKIMLPTETQWQYAAQGDDGRAYPWGPDWDCKRCNNSVKPCGSSVTMPVTQYEGKHKGDSPFGVVDMAGNIWEWCLTDYERKTNDPHSNANMRVWRGGSWFNFDTDKFRCDFRGWNSPHGRFTYWGFRLSRS